VYLIPTSIAYDQIQDVGDYVAEQRGAAKQKESFGWFLRLIRSLQRRYGDIHIRFGEPISLQQALGPPDPTAEPNPDEQNLALQKVAFEVAVRINRVTPITPTSLVTLALLGVGDRALTLEETAKSLKNIIDYVRRRRLPTTTELRDLDTPDGLRRALDALVESGVVSRFAEGPEPVYKIGSDQHLTAAYYRNTIIHFFVNGAIAELALLAAAEDDVGDRRAAFWEEAMQLRDLLKFEFFFSDKEEFRAELRDEVALHDPSWEASLIGVGEGAPAGEGGAAAIHALIRRFKPFSAHRTLRPFVDAYRVVGDALEREDPAAPFDEQALLARCIALGKQYDLQRRVSSHESVSKVLFATALRLARNRGVVTGDVPADPGDLAFRLHAFAEEIRTVVRRVDAIDALAASRRAGLID
jgi:glycerol-3-phosphate O-acyltransferase